MKYNINKKSDLYKKHINMITSWLDELFKIHNEVLFDRYINHYIKRNKKM